MSPNLTTSSFSSVKDDAGELDRLNRTAKRFLDWTASLKPNTSFNPPPSTLNPINVPPFLGKAAKALSASGVNTLPEIIGYTRTTLCLRAF
jgi:hypothetical protein